jgi:hypothetical protein
MTREEAIVLVSRALAVIQLVSAGEDVTYFPAYILRWRHYGGYGGNLIFP